MKAAKARKPNPAQLLEEDAAIPQHLKDYLGGLQAQLTELRGQFRRLDVELAELKAGRLPNV